MRKAYAAVEQENGALVGEYTKRSNNHEELVKSLKELNNYIRKASNMRVGPHQKRVVAESRECIRSNTTQKIPMVSKNREVTKHRYYKKEQHRLVD